MAEKIKWPPKTKWSPNHKTDHNSLNFQARSSRFCMVVHIYLLKITHFGKQNGHQIPKLIITHSISKLGAPDFAWKFLLTFGKLYVLENKMAAKNNMAAYSQN